MDKTPQKSQALLAAKLQSSAPSTPTTPADSSSSSSASTLSSPSVQQQQQAAPERTPFLVLSAPILNFNDAIQAQPSLQFAFDEINQDVIVQNGNSIDFVSTKSGQKFTYNFSAQFTILQPRSSPARNYFSAIVSDRKMIICNLKTHERYDIEYRDNKANSAKILGYMWVGDNYVVCITTLSLDMYRVLDSAKPVKNIAANTKFFKYNHQHRILLVCLEGKPHQLQPFKITDTSIAKLSLVKLEIPAAEPAESAADIHLTCIYEKLYIIHLCPQRQEMTLFQYAKDNFAFSKTFNLFSMGEFALSVVDNLLLVHNIKDKLTYTYDVRAQNMGKPVCPPLPVTSSSIVQQQIQQAKKYVAAQQQQQQDHVKLPERIPDPWESVDPYAAPSCEFIHPNLILDKNSGYLFEVQLLLNEMPIGIKKRSEVIKFLFRRASSKIVLVKKIKKYIETRESLAEVTSLFSLINVYYQSRELLKNKLQQQILDSEEDDILVVQTLGYGILDQTEMYSYVFVRLDEDDKIPKDKLAALVVEYIRSLMNCPIPIQQFIQRFLIDLMLKGKHYHMLHHYIQYKVITDHKQTAQQIISVANEYKPAYQMALDMLTRLQAYDTICDTLLARKEISHALQFMYKFYEFLEIKPKLVFETVLAMNDPVLFYNAYEIMQKIKQKMHYSKEFEKELKLFDEQYQTMFNSQKRRQ